MKRLMLTATLTLISAPAFAADPTEAVQFFYNDPGSELATENRGRFTGKAKEVLDLADATNESDDGPCIGFMPSVDGQDFDDAELKASLNLAGGIAGDDASVEATFKQFGQDAKINWILERVDGEWKVSDIQSPANDWTLSKFECAAQ